ncbi:MAG: 2-amino-4-hydroxy-6-hydroxymethyldihydropteridine diphosphokinase [Planctomycetaceae bacterium]
MTPSYLALGGNVGPVERTFERALEQLDALPGTTVRSVSGVFRFPAVGAGAGGEFHNAAARVDTNLEPLDLLLQLQRIEDRHGRVRDVVWGPRPLDVDLILYGDRILSHPQLRVPHPGCWYRRFVLDPLAEIAADVTHPEKQATVRELRERLLPRPLPVVLLGDQVKFRNELLTTLSSEFADVELTEADFAGWTSVDRRQVDEPALLIWLGTGKKRAAGRFQSLPLLSRLDVSQHPDPLESVRAILRSALGR